MIGWIKLDRALCHHWVAESPDTLSVWIRLLLDANFKDKDKVFNGKKIILKRGQLIFGLNAFSDKTGVSVSKLRRILDLFISEGMISRQKTNKYSIITITCYDQYQGIDNQTAGKEQPDSKQITTPKEGKEGKESKEGKKVKEKPTPANKFTDEDKVCAEYIFSLINQINPNAKPPNMNNWCNTIRLMRERDNRSHKQICEVFRWANNDVFWQTNILSPDKLRDQFDHLVLKMGKAKPVEKHDLSDKDYGETGEML